MTLAQYAEKVVQDMHGPVDPDKTQEAFDPSFILMVIEILQTVLPWIKSCLEARKVPGAAISTSVAQRIALTLHVRRAVMENGGNHWFWREHGKKLVESMINVASTLREEDVNAIYVEN